jgi:flagellar biosynthesis protein FliQ
MEVSVASNTCRDEQIKQRCFVVPVLDPVLLIACQQALNQISNQSLHFITKFAG